MKLKNFSTDIFAGVSDLEVNFAEGLNVLFGLNESGKSTIVNAIFACLFEGPKIDLRKDKNFKNKFFPYPQGDYVEGTLEFAQSGKSYQIYKKWSRNNPAADFKLPDNSRISSPEKIKSQRQKLLPYGKTTYENIVFTRQEEVKSFLENITEENELTEFKGTVDNFLRRAVMELDGVSTDSLKNKISTELEELVGKWDLEENRPIKPERDIRNPYKRGTGKIYDTFIEIQSLEQNIEEAKQKEQKYLEVSSKVEELKEQKEKLQNKVEELAEQEEELLQREKITREISDINEKVAELKDINEKWPVKKKELKTEKEKLAQCQEKIEKLQQEKERAQKLEKKAKLENKTEKVEALQEEIEELESEREELGEITEKKVKKLAECKNTRDNTKASLQAGKLTARINYSRADEITVIPGLEEEKTVEAETEVQADGYIKINTEYIDLEVESAEIDFCLLQKKYTEAENSYKELLQELQVEDVDSAREKLENKKTIKNAIERKRDKIDNILEEKKYQQVKKEIKELNGLEEARSKEEIEAEIDTCKDDKRDCEKNIEILSGKIAEWENEYNSHEKLTDNMAELQSKKEKLQTELEKLADLPQGFASFEDYKAKLKKARKNLENLNTKLRNKEGEMYRVKSELPETSVEELEMKLNQAQNVFKRLVKRAEKLQKIKRVFKSKLSEMDENSYEPLINSFSNYLSELTAGKYTIGSIDDRFREIKLKNEMGEKLPADIDKLSYGTFDGAALALRFALFHNLFADRESFIVLDDCLVNFDPQRREKAIDLINNFAEEYQIIYTTCRPETAEALGGNIIEL